MNVEVNFMAMILAAVSSMAIGFLWYSPMVVGTQWMKLKGYTKESLRRAQSEMGKLYALSFVVAIVTAFMLSHVMALSENFYGYPKLQTGITTAISMWLGFIMPVQMTSTIFGEKKWALFGIDTGYQLASMLTMGIVLGLL